MYPSLQTARLVLRPWTREDLEPFARLNADPDVMEFFAAPLSREQSDAAFDRIVTHWQAYGFGIWVAESSASGEFAGMLGLMHPRIESVLGPCVELGYRFHKRWWGKGLATEGSKAALAFGFGELGLSEIVSFTTLANQRSRKVMEKCGFQLSHEFDHPDLAEGHPLRRHVLYRLAASLEA